MKRAILSDEVTNDPLARGYAGMTNEAVAEDIETAYRPGLCEPGSLGRYLALNRKNNMSLLGRLEILANSALATDPLGDGATLTLAHVAACAALLLASADSLFTVNTQDANFQLMLVDVAGGPGARAVGPAHITAITALSDNRQTRAAELDIETRVRAGDIQRARA